MQGVIAGMRRVQRAADERPLLCERIEACLRKTFFFEKRIKKLLRALSRTGETR